MTSRFSVEGLAATSARHPWRVVIAWLIILIIGGGYAAFGLNDVLNNEMTLTADVESVVGLEKLHDSSLSDQANVTETILVRSLDGTTVDDPAFEERANGVVHAVRTLQGEWIGEGPIPAPNPLALASGNLEGAVVLNYFELRQFNNDMVEQLRNKDGTVVLIPVTFDEYEDGLPIRQYIDVVEQFDDERFDVTTIGNASINDEFQVIVIEDLIAAEMVGIPIAILVLVIIAIFVLMFAIAGIVSFVVSRKHRQERESALPMGADTSEFARDLQARYRKENDSDF